MRMLPANFDLLAPGYAGSRACYDVSYPSAMVRSTPPPVIFVIRVFVFAPHGVFIRVPIDGYELALALVWVEAS